jgi:GT2 family glycosyltransferase
MDSLGKYYKIGVSLMEKVFIVIPNWNGKDTLPACLDSLLAQTQKARILVVENGSTDGSLDFLHSNYPQIDLVVNTRNLGFAGGVNSGIKRATELGAKYVALFNNDAVADKNWLKELIQALDNHTEAGSATCKLLSADKKHIDSTGDFYTTWGLPYPRGRGEPASDKYDTETEVFGASGGASLYRVKMLQEIGLFDEDFFAYYEDVDLSFRAQLAGWKVIYVPEAEAYHQQGVTSGKIKGFTTYQTFKNYPMLLIKNVPFRLLPGVFIRFEIAYSAIFISSIQQGRMWPALKGFLRSQVLLPKKLWERQRIQERRKVPVSYINSLLVHDLPPNAAKLRKLRSFFVR